MAPRNRVIGWIALAAFAALAASGGAATPPPCCSPACDRCPVTVCAPPAVEASVGKAGAPPSLAADAVLPLLFGRFTIAAIDRAPQMLRSPAHVFRRPMRI